MADSDKTTKKKKKTRKKRTRKPTQFMLVWVTETAPVTGDDGKPIPGTERRCYVEMDLPPGLDESGKRSRDSIKRAVKKAVYEEGMTEYGNKDLAVISRDGIFSVDYERVTVTKLLPPAKAEKVRQENGKDVVTTTDDPEPDPEENSSYDDEDSDDDDEDETTGSDNPEPESEPATTAS